MEHHQNGNEGQQGGAEQIQAATEAAKPEHHHRQQQPGRSCPRCSSTNTKFCYYNNYIQSQPRYFCKDCRRYWTHGGSLRNVPIGGRGGSFRKYKRPGRPRATLPSASPHLPSTQLIVPSPSLLTSSFSAPCYNPTSFYSGGGGAGIFSSWMGPQPMNQMPETLPSNMGNLLHVSDAKPFGLTGFLPPGAGSSTTMAAGVGGSQDISDLKLHHDLFDNVGNVGDIHDQLV